MIRVLFLHIVFFISYAAFSQELYHVERLPFCAKYYDEISPVYYKDGLVFCSNMKRGSLIAYLNENDDASLDIFYIPKRDSIWGELQYLSPDLMSVYNEGPVSFTGDGQVIYYTRNNNISGVYGKGNKEKNKFGIYSAEKTEAGWGNIKNFTYSDPAYRYGYPSVSPDGKMLFFSSDKPGGQGGFDIFICKNVNGLWTSPENLGDKINTSGNELYPFYHPSGVLFFASDQLPGNGKYDIFKTIFVNGEWTIPENIGAPFNTEESDFGFIIDKDFRNGYYTSSQGKSNDILSFYPVADFDSCFEIKNYVSSDNCYVFYEPGTIDVDTTAYKYEWDLGDGTKIRAVQAEHCYAKPGKYDIQLNVIDTLTGEVLMNQASYVLEIEGAPLLYFEVPDAFDLGQIIQLNASQCNISEQSVVQYAWSMDHDMFKQGKSVSYTAYKPGNHAVKLLLTYKDEKGNLHNTCGYRRITVNKGSKINIKFQ